MAVPLSRLVPTELLPTDQLTSEESPLSVLERILVTQLSHQSLDPGPGAEAIVGLTVADEVELGFPGLDGLAVVLAGRDATTLQIDVHAAPNDVVVRLSGTTRL